MAIAMRTFLSVSVYVYCFYLLTKVKEMQPRPVTQNYIFYLSSLKCFEFCEDVGSTISQLPAKDAAFIRETKCLIDQEICSVFRTVCTYRGIEIIKEIHL